VWRRNCSGPENFPQTAGPGRGGGGGHPTHLPIGVSHPASDVPSGLRWRDMANETDVLRNTGRDIDHLEQRIERYVYLSAVIRFALRER